MEKALGYVRVSTREQAESGCSLEAQETRIRAYCELAGLELAGIIREQGVSGSKPLATRPAGCELVRALAKREAVHVVSVKLDRLFRNAIDALEQTAAWDHKNIALHLIDFGGQAINTKSAMGRMFLTLQAGFAELERNLISERTAAALGHKKAKREAYSPTPFGCERLNGNLVDNARELETVSRILARVHAGRSFSAIARDLNAEGTPTKRGGRWHARTVAYISRNTLHAAAAELAIAA